MRPVHVSSAKKGPPTKPKPKPNGNAKEKDPVEVYCRLRPLSNFSDIIAVKKFSDSIVQLTAPNGRTAHYSFKYVFDDKTNQKTLFDRMALPLVEDLLRGKNGLLFTYGITSSGKTYTVTGNPQNTGLLPRCLDAIFNSISNLQSRKHVFKPDGQNYFEIQSSPDALLEWQREKNTPKTPSNWMFAAKTPKSRKRYDNCEENWENRVKDDMRVEGINSENHYALFVSYVEIYNNYIYDLLDDSFDSIRPQPQSKTLREDPRKRVFVNGGTEVEVKSAEEAFGLFIKGIRRRRIAHTALNTESSRSHSVFNMRIVQAPLDSSGTEVIQDIRFLTVSQLSLVDLAGSERSVRTQNTGDRMRETGNINNSLMALRTCIEALRDNQRNGLTKVVPYRDNKLTHLFKSYFEGEGKVRMLICVNPGADDYDETINVMKFAELSQDVVVARGVEPPIYMHQYNRETNPKLEYFGGVDLAPLTAIGPAYPSAMPDDPEDDKIFPEWIECIQMRERNRKSKLQKLKDRELEFRHHLTEIERENMVLKQRISVYQMDLEGREQQIKNIENKYNNMDVIGETQHKRIGELQRRSRALEHDCELKDKIINDFEREREQWKIMAREKIEYERERLKRIFRRVLEEKEAQLEREQCVNKEKMQIVRQILNADNTNWEFLKENRESFFPGNVLPSATVPSGGNGSASTTPAGAQTLKRRSEYDSAQYGTPLAGTSKISTPHSAESLVPGGETNNRPPVINPRHRRSLSSGNEKWIDHRPPGTIDLGTVLQPNIKNRKSVSSLKSSDILNNASKYALTHHEADQRGYVETQIYKGEVIPSSSGGAQVIFNDIETLKQGSPPVRKRTASESRYMSPQVGPNQISVDVEVHAPNNKVSRRSRR